MKAQIVQSLAGLPSYDPWNWFWVVGGDETKVYSSASGDYVAPTSAPYLAWVERGNVATKIATEAGLGEVLAPYALRPTNANILDGYKDSQASKLTIETVAKVLFNHENRIRVLEGKQPATPAQFKSALKDLM